MPKGMKPKRRHRRWTPPPPPFKNTPEPGVNEGGYFEGLGLEAGVSGLEMPGGDVSGMEINTEQDTEGLDIRL